MREKCSWTPTFSLLTNWFRSSFIWMDVRALCYAKTVGFLLSMEEVYILFDLEGIILLCSTIPCRFTDACIHNPFTISLYPPLPSAIQIFYNGYAHWVTTFSDGNEIFLFDSLTHDDLPSTLEEQIAAVYASFCSKDGLLTITKVGVQQQKGMTDCGLFAIAFAYHSARGDDVSKLEFDQSIMRQHLLDCFQSEELKPFPMTTAKPKKRKSKHIFIHLYCTCLMPASYDVQMIECDVCAKWFHFKCVGLRGKCPKRWVCRCCRYDSL